MKQAGSPVDVLQEMHCFSQLCGTVSDASGLQPACGDRVAGSRAWHWVRDNAHSPETHCGVLSVSHGRLPLLVSPGRGRLYRGDRCTGP